MSVPALQYTHRRIDKVRFEPNIGWFCVLLRSGRQVTSRHDLVPLLVCRTTSWSTVVGLNTVLLYDLVGYYRHWHYIMA